MIKRIVRLTFQEDKISEFLETFNRNKSNIRNVEGCRYLELLQDQKDNRVVFTLSHWDNEEALNRYRASALFKETWARVKPLFADKPLAWSLGSLELLK